MISYSSRAARAIGFLKKAYNDIEVYVEDSSSHTMWLRIIQTLLPKNVRLKSVNPLRGRDTVIDACKRDQDNDGRKRIYIVDGDFDFLLGKKRPKLRRLYRLRAYCVENLLLNTEALIELSIDACGDPDRNMVSKRLDLSGLIQCHEVCLRKLFYAYAAVYKAAPAVQTVGYSVMRLTSAVGAIISLDREKVRKRNADLVRLARNFASTNVIRRTLKECQKRGSKLSLELVVSGKDYLLPLIWLKIRREFSYKGSQEQFKIQLAKEFNTRSEPYLTRAIRRAAA